MTCPNITILWNSTNVDSPNEAGPGGTPGTWNVFDTVNDQMSFLGSGTVDQDPTSSKDVFVIPESGSQEVPKQFIKDYSESKWDRVWLAGSNANSGGGGNYKFAYGAYIDGTSASVPQLMCFDSTTHTTYDLEVLGSGTPANSMIRAVSTRYAAPGDSWAGTPLAGSGGSNIVALDTTAITAPQMLYWNMRMLVPSSANPFAANPILCIYMTYS